MAFEARPTSELIRIANAGGGFSINAGARSTLDLIAIANAAGVSGARITFHKMAARPTADLIQIANAGKGSVAFED